MSNQIRANEVLIYDRKYIWFAGFYHSKTLKKHFLYYTTRILILTVFCLFPMLILLSMILDKSSINTILYHAIFLTCALWFTTKVSLHIHNLPKLRALEDLLEADVFNMHTQDQNRFLHKTRTMISYALRIYWCVSCNVVIIFILCPIVTNYYLNVPIWIPFTSDEEHITSYIFESIYLMLATYIYPTIDCILIGLMLMVVAQLKILKDSLKRSTERHINDDYFAQEKKIQARLRSCVIHHNAIHVLVSKVEEIVSQRFFWQVFFSSVELCIIALQLYVEAEDAQLGIMLFIFACVVGQVAIFCWCGQQLINQSSDITEACYMSEWYTCSVASRKLLLIIMTNTQTPIILYAGKLFSISYDSFVNIIRNAYSYYVVFMQIYQA